MKERNSYIMRMAWVIVKETGMSFGYALRMAWKNFRLQSAMRKDVVRFAYMKLSGGLREARGTLCGMFIPGGLSSEGTGRRQNEGVLCYYDMDKNGWRSFHKANLISVQ